MTDAERDALVARLGRVQAPPLCPELRLHLADAVLPVWEEAERAVGQGPLATPFWAFAWAGGQALARAVLDAPQTVRGRRVLDFASGCGVSAIAAVRAGAAHVLAAEIDPLAVAAVRVNAALNGAAVEARLADLVGADEGWETVLAGDVCYHQEVSARIEAWLRRLAARGAHVLLADAGRKFAPRAGLQEVARFEVPTTVDLEGVERRVAAVWRVLPG